jgi:DHA3 family multidrug efflux protein-like MFS transporter
VLLAFVSRPYRRLSAAYASAPPSLETDGSEEAGEPGGADAAGEFGGARATGATGEAGENLRSTVR